MSNQFCRFQHEESLTIFFIDDNIDIYVNIISDMDIIKSMHAFAAVASEESFTDAGRRLGLSTNLISKYVRQLEEHLGAQLLHRTTRSVTLTETGAAYFERCVPLLEQVEELEDLVQNKQGELAGPIRITAPTGFGSRELVNAIKPFQLNHPNVFIDLHLSDQHVAIIEEGFDLAIRFGQLADSSLVARKLLDMRVVVTASPGYLETNGIPQTPYDLADHNCLISTVSADRKNWHFKTNEEEISIPVSGSFQADAPRAIVEMAAGGLGIGMIPYYSAAPHIDNGHLVILFEELEAIKIGLHVVYPPSRHLTARIRALIDHLGTAFH